MGYKSRKAAMRKARLSKPQDLMYTLCDFPDKEILCGKSSDRMPCDIECFRVHNPGMERALNDPNSDEAKHYGDKIQSKAKSRGINGDYPR